MRTTERILSAERHGSAACRSHLTLRGHGGLVECVHAPVRPAQRTLDDYALPLQDALTESDVKHQHIVYRLVNGKRHVPETPIDFLGTMREMEGLVYGMENFICITNKNVARGGFVQFLRLDRDEWYVDIPINMGRGWDGYVWGCHADTRLLSDTLRLFFEEVPWFGMLPWTMSRVAHS